MSEINCVNVNVIHPSINASINNADFPLFLKLVNVIPVFKKNSKNSKDNYTPISVLKNISKVYQRISFKQIGTFMDNFFFQNFNTVLETVMVHSNIYLH